MIPNINKQIVNKITSDPELNKNASNKFVQDTLSNIKKYENKEATDSDEESTEPKLNLSYYKSLYLPEEKSFIGSYIVSDDSQSNTIEVINIIENEFESRMFVDGARPFNIEIHKIKLPKSQVEIIGDVEGYEPFKYVKLPYWLYKKNKDVLKIQKINGKKRFAPNKSNDRPEFIQKLQDKHIEDYFNMEAHDKAGRKNFESLKNKKNKEENTEATGSGSSGGFEGPLFSSADRFVTKPIKTSKLTEEEKYTTDAKNNIDNIFNNMPKLKDLKPYGLKYSVKTIKNLLVKKIRDDGKFRDNKWIREEMPFSKEVDILNVLLQSSLAEFYFKSQAKKRNKGHYDWAMNIGKEDLDNFPIPHTVFNTLVIILKNDGDDIKKVETKEATGSGSSGSYETPAAWAKSGSRKNWRGARKPQIPGGKFVEVRKKCQKFPYCNQGDIKSLKIFENERIEKIIKNISKKHNISENVIKNILSYELDVFRKYKK